MLLSAVTLSIFALSIIFAMLGLGGAMLYIPVFHWFGYDFRSVVIPTGLLLNGVTALSAAIFYLKARMVDVKGSVPLVISSFIGAPVGAWFTSMVPTDTLILLFCIGMVFAGGRMLLTSGAPEKDRLMAPGLRYTLMGIAGFFIGMIAGLLGIGGGFLFVPMMIAMGYPTKTAAATSSFVVIFSSFSGFAGHIAEGHFNWPLMAATTVAVIIGSQIGAKVMKEKMKPAWIKKMFGVVLLGVAAKLLWKLYL
ncbi:MAG: permease [Desulfococcus sp. 4484_241]|nr:MAG: permease [Desulfococcus sp. 4484_241]RLC32381.1 MAG: sulfite exporter TauE/SafE family protein [Deltaproteobacteria bacterium]